MKTATITGFILGSRNLGENDKTIFIYHHELGKIKATAKGCRKFTSKFVGHLETLNKIQASIYFGPKNIILTEITNTRISRNSNFNNLKSRLQIAEITNQLIYESQIVEGLEMLIENTLRQLEISSKTTLITISYIIKILDKTGIIPDFEELIINDPNNKIDPKYLKFINFAKEKPFNEIEKITLSESEENFLKKIFALIIEREIGKKLSSFQL